jgi:hypothetical protein
VGETYQAIRAQAQAAANADGYDRGVEKLGDRWRSFMLPQVRNRFGFELRCEVVFCMDLSRCALGHGPHPVYVKRRVLRRPRAMP